MNRHQMAMVIVVGADFIASISNINIISFSEQSSCSQMLCKLNHLQIEIDFPPFVTNLNQNLQYLQMNGKSQNDIITISQNLQRLPEEFRAQRVNLSNGKWRNLNFDCQSRLITSWYTVYLFLYSNFLPKILEPIEHIIFPSLKLLLLDYNHIESIQSLILISMPQIQSLQISNNYISDVGSLSKANWPCLKRINYNNNYIKEWRPLQSIYNRNLETLKLDYSWVQCDNLAFLLKCQIDSLKNACIRLKQKISHCVIECQLHSKYVSLRIHKN